MKVFNILPLIIIILLAGSNITYDINESTTHQSIFETQDLNIQQPEELDYSISTQEQTIQNSKPQSLSMQGGGCWLDTFDNNTMIDWTRTNNINLSFGKVRLDLVKVDEHTVAMWHFDKGSGITAYDESMNYNNGTLGGNGIGTDLPTWSNGVYGNGLSYDGADDYVDFGFNKTLNLVSEITIESWINPSGWGEYLNYGFGRIVDKSKYLLYLHKTQNPTYNTYSLVFTLEIGTTNYPSNTPTSSISLNEWQYVAVTYDGSSVKMYINGNSQTLTQPDGQPSGNIDNNVNDYLFVGESPTADRAFDGYIDEIRISNKSRSPVTKNGNLTSEEISLPPGMQWDTLIIDKFQPQNTAIEVKILDASNNQQIPGSPLYTLNGEFDISYLNPDQYPFIKLNASFVGKQLGPEPVLNYWGVSWNKSDTWQDTFFGGVKVDDSSRVNVVDGEALFRNNGHLISTAITIPDKHYYNTLTINKSEPIGSSLKVNVLDAQTNSPIPEYIDLTSKNIDVSKLDPHKFPALKLKASYSSTGQIGKLFDWSVNWTENTAPNFLDISMPDSINRTFMAKLKINLTDQEDLEKNLTPIIEVKPPGQSNWGKYYLWDPYYVNEHWVCNFTPSWNADVGEYYFRFFCSDKFLKMVQYPQILTMEVRNNHPRFLSVEPSKVRINRTEPMEIIIESTDVETPDAMLTVEVRYRHESEYDWETILDVPSNGVIWYPTFRPPADAMLGRYIFNISCNDYLDDDNFDVVYYYLELEVLNNKPTAPNITLSPQEPRTLDDLDLIILSESKDIETKQVDYWYRWYKDNVYMPNYDNLSSIPHHVTAKGHSWKCIVQPFDGDDLGPAVEASVTILNSGPRVLYEFEDIQMFEDSMLVLGNKLKMVFTDADNDTLVFNASETENIKIEIIPGNGTLIITPDEDWYGIETVTFYATDQIETTEEIVVIEVIPTNDLPRLVKIGSQQISTGKDVLDFQVDEDDVLIVTITVEDIDGDLARGMIRYFLNETGNPNLYIEDTDLIFKPKNADVGWHYLNITVTDGNETPTEYVNQTIRINVENVNDPPTVEILAPKDGKEFTSADKISFDCLAEDVDLLIPDTMEKLSYQWTTNKTKNKNLGSGREVRDITLPEGYYRITVTVTDSDGAEATDSIRIVVRKVDDSEAKIEFTSSLFLIAVIIILIIIILIISLIIINRRKKERLKELGIHKEEVLHPVDAYRPEEPTKPLIKPSETMGYQPPLYQTTQAAQAQAPLPVPMKSLPGTHAAPPPGPGTGPGPVPVPQLPVRQPAQGQTVPQQQQQPTAVDQELTPETKLQLLEDRLVRGEIPYDVYSKLKVKYESELEMQMEQQAQTSTQTVTQDTQAKKEPEEEQRQPTGYQPAPKLLPAKDGTTVKSDDDENK
jgi:hypothetical protein